MKSQSQDFSRLIHEKKRFLISCHIHPDGDGIGSLLALGLSLTAFGKKVSMVCTDGAPSVYNFLDGNNTIVTEFNPEFNPEVLICVDCSEKERVAISPEIWNVPGLMVVNIDHHLTNTEFGNINIIDANAGAAGEIVFQIITAEKLPINQKIAAALYTAIATDTGFFRYNNTSALTLEIASLLVKNYHVEPAKVAEQVHEQKSYKSIRLLGEVLNTLKLGIGGKLAWMVMDQQMLAKYPVENEETESYVNYARSIEGVEIGLLFKELKPNEIKLSWRSTSAADVSKLASYFGGGGHARAAGCTITGSVDSVVNEVISFIEDYYGAR